MGSDLIIWDIKERRLVIQDIDVNRKKLIIWDIDGNTPKMQKETDYSEY